MSISNLKNKMSGCKPVNVSKKGRHKSFGLHKSSEKWKTILSNGVAERSHDIRWQLNYLESMKKKSLSIPVMIC